MSEPARRREPLSRERVLRAAVALADTEGVAAVTMRRLGQELGVEAMSLYNHVRGKDDVLDGMVDLVAAEIPAATAAEWRATLRRLCVEAHAALVRHPWAAGMWMGRRQVGPARMRFMDDVLGTLRRAGFSPHQTHRAFHVIDNHVLGAALAAEAFQTGANDLRHLAEDFLRRVDAEQVPHLVEHVRVHLGEIPPEEPDDLDDFAFGLDLVLDGLSRALGRDGRDPAAPRPSTS